MAVQAMEMRMVPLLWTVISNVVSNGCIAYNVMIEQQNTIKLEEIERNLEERRNRGLN